MTTTTKLNVSGMHCSGCERGIEQALGDLLGVETVKADHVNGTVLVDFDDRQTGQQAIESLVVSMGYSVLPPQVKKMPVIRRLLLFVTLLAVVGGVAFWGKSLMPGLMQQMNIEIGYAMLFGIGFLTGFHCIGMCGSFIVSYADEAKSNTEAAISHLSYGAGKTLSYTVIGAMFGLIGALVTITPLMRGVAAILAGVFLFAFGFFASYLSRKALHDMVRVSGVLVIIMGLMMVDRGLLLTGSGFDSGSWFN